MGLPINLDTSVVGFWEGRSTKIQNALESCILSSAEGPVEPDRPNQEAGVWVVHGGMTAASRWVWLPGYLDLGPYPEPVLLSWHTLRCNGVESRPVRRNRGQLQEQPMTEDPEAALTFKRTANE